MVRVRVLYIFLLLVACWAGEASAQFSDYDYTLGFELNSRTGKYGPAYTYKSNKRTSTIWLDGANKQKNRIVGKSTSASAEKLLVYFEWPVGWQVNTNVHRAQARSTNNSLFTIFPSRSLSGRVDRKNALVAEWQKITNGKPGEVNIDEIVEGDFKGKGKYDLFVSASEKDATALVMIYAENRVLPVLFEFPSYTSFTEDRAKLRNFILSIDLKKGQVDSSKGKS